MWSRGRVTGTPIRIGNVKESTVALIDHGSEINIRSKEFYGKGKWPIKTNQGWRIRETTKATEELFVAGLNVLVKIKEVEIN